MTVPNPRKRPAADEFVHPPQKIHVTAGHHDAGLPRPFDPAAVFQDEALPQARLGTGAQGVVAQPDVPQGSSPQGSSSYTPVPHRAVPHGAAPQQAVPRFGPLYRRVVYSPAGYTVVPQPAAPLQALPQASSPHGSGPYRVGFRPRAVASGSYQPEPMQHLPHQRYGNHPQSCIGHNSHFLPYPLDCMPYESWYALRNGGDNLNHFRCATCPQKRNLTLHIRKVFLVAERLAKIHGFSLIIHKRQNEELNREVSHQLGILDPFVEEGRITSGKHSRFQQWYPYKNEFEMKRVMDVIANVDHLTEASWALWTSAHRAMGLMSDTQSASSEMAQIISFRTLQDFYSLLDQIERGSYVAARFLEAYADRLNLDFCADCWAKHNIESDA